MILSSFINMAAVLWMALIIHELGHAAVAVAFGRNVTEFVIGASGPKLVKRQFGGFKLVIGWFPLGGHVMFKHSFDWRVNVAVMLAGPFANILSAMLVIGALLFANTPDDFKIWGPIYAVYSLFMAARNLITSAEGSDGWNAMRTFKRHVARVLDHKEFLARIAAEESKRA